MDWSNEDYVRMYTRETPDDASLSWDAISLWRAMLCKFDRAGRIDTRTGVRGLAALVRMPVDLAGPALDDLIRDGRVRAITSGYFAPNFVAAQTASKSDRQRQKESRERRTSDALADLERTTDNTLSQPVTTGHDQSHLVTLSSALLCSADPFPDPPIPPKGGSDSSVSSSSRGKRTRAKVDATPAELASVRVVLDRLGTVAGVAYRGCDAHQRLIIARLRDGITEIELRAVVAYCADEWEDKPEMRKYLRPETLFGPQTIAKYLDAARARYADKIAAATAQPDLKVVK